LYAVYNQNIHYPEAHLLIFHYHFINYSSTLPALYGILHATTWLHFAINQKLDYYG